MNRLRVLFVSACAPAARGTGSEQRSFVAWNALSEIGDVFWLEGPPSASDLNRESGSTRTHLSTPELLKKEPTLWSNYAKPNFFRRAFRDCWVTAGRVSPPTAKEGAALFAQVCSHFGHDAFDIVWAFQVPAGAWISDIIPRLLKPNGVSILDWDAAERPGIQLQAQYLKQEDGLRSRVAVSANDLKLGRIERRLLDSMTITVCASAVDEQYFRWRRPDIVVRSIPNSIEAPATVHPPPRKQRVLFVGLINYWPNRDGLHLFLREIWPVVRRRVPSAEFEIVGRGVTSDIAAFDSKNGVSVVGAVEDVSMYYASCDVAVAPMRFSVGSSIKVLEALAHGRPVVAFDAATRRHGLGNGTHVRAAHDAQEFAAELISLLEDAELAQRTAELGRSFVLENYSRKSVTTKLQNLVESAFSCKQR
jgi:glycosyltransferase involved in cell wall biosynthesis